MLDTWIGDLAVVLIVFSKIRPGEAGRPRKRTALPEFRKTAAGLNPICLSPGYGNVLSEAGSIGNTARATLTREEPGGRRRSIVETLTQRLAGQRRPCRCYPRIEADSLENNRATDRNHPLRGIYDHVLPRRLRRIGLDTYPTLVERRGKRAGGHTYAQS